MTITDTRATHVAEVARTDPRWEARKAAVLALGAAEPRQAVAALIQALADGMVDVRRAAVESLEQWAGDRTDVSAALTAALTDPDPGVRTQVRWALA